MATEILFFDETGDAVSVIPFELDAVPEELHRMTAQVTDHEVETGVAITDHVRAEPRMLTLNVVVSHAKLIGDDNETPSRMRDAWALLTTARDAGQLAIITTAIATYEDMVLIEAQAPRVAADGTWLRAELTFKEVRFVTTQVVADPVPARARDRRQVDRGQQGTEEAPERRRSILHRGVGLLGEYL